MEGREEQGAMSGFRPGRKHDNIWFLLKREEADIDKVESTRLTGMQKAVWQAPEKQTKNNKRVLTYDL